MYGTGVQQHQTAIVTEKRRFCMSSREQSVQRNRGRMVRDGGGKSGWWVSKPIVCILSRAQSTTANSNHRDLIWGRETMVSTNRKPNHTELKQTNQSFKLSQSQL